MRSRKWAALGCMIVMCLGLVCEPFTQVNVAASADETDSNLFLMDENTKKQNSEGNNRVEGAEKLSDLGAVSSRIAEGYRGDEELAGGDLGRALAKKNQEYDPADAMIIDYRNGHVSMSTGM